MSTFDPAVCEVDFTDGNYLFVQPAGACSTEECRWDLSTAEARQGAIPSSYQGLQPYTCDNVLRNLSWPDMDTGFPNRYLCACGQELSNSTAGGKLPSDKRFTTPWQADFGRRCNVVAAAPIKIGNITAGNSVDGACVNMSAKSRAAHLWAEDVGQDDWTYIDGFGIASLCSGAAFDGDSARICSCTGELPEAAFGRKVENRDPCGLARRDDKAWIAGPVVGGAAVASCLALTLFLHLKRRSKKLVKTDSGVSLIERGQAK